LRGIARNMQAKCQAPTLKENLAQYRGRPLLLFLSNERSSRSDAGDCNARLKAVLRAFGFALLSDARGRRLFFSLISESSTFTLIAENSDIKSHLKSIGLSRDMPENEKVIVLQSLIVEEFFRQNWHVYEPYLVTSTDHHL